jgi:hypothetical protein
MAEARPAAEIAQAFLRSEQELVGFAAGTRALSDLAASLDPPGLPVPALPPGAEDVIADIRRLNTMQAERAIHDALFPQLAAPIPAAQDTEEILFG